MRVRVRVRGSGWGREGAGSAGIPVWGVAESGTGQNSRRQAHSLRAARGAHSPNEGDVAGSAPSCLPRLASLRGRASWALTRHTGPALDLGLPCRGAEGETQLPWTAWQAHPWPVLWARSRLQAGMPSPGSETLRAGVDPWGRLWCRVRTRARGEFQPGLSPDHGETQQKEITPSTSCPRARVPPTDGRLLARPELLKPPAIVADPRQAEVFLVLGGRLPPPSFSPGSSWSLEHQR